MSTINANRLREGVNAQGEMIPDQAHKQASAIPEPIAPAAGHTPGDWRWKWTAWEGFTVMALVDVAAAPPLYRIIARVEKGDHAAANTKLIAAAKLLLAACEQAEQALRNLATGFLTGDAALIAEIEAANLREDIAMAKGEA